MRRPDRVAIERFGHRVKWRWRWTIVAFAIGGGSTWAFRTAIFQWLLAPAEGRLSPFPGGPPVFTAPGDLLGASFGLAIKGGLALAAPVFIVGVYTLAAPILPRQPRRFINLFVPAAVLFFAGGVAFVYYVMLPVSLGFLLNFGDGIAVPLISLKQYLDLLTAFMFWIGLIFELPLAMFLLSKTGVVSYPKFRRVPRRVVISASLILAAIITPTFDLMNWAMVGVPIYVLYEVGLFFAWAARPEDGDYFFIKKTSRAIIWVVRRPAVGFRKFKRGVRKVLRR